ncbi:peptidylprolyl isomerase [bacterium]|nr:peptidylprolyl isomerase [candidate division CSSED10-310 bacterium]
MKFLDMVLVVLLAVALCGIGCEKKTDEVSPVRLDGPGTGPDSSAAAPATGANQAADAMVASIDGMRITKMDLDQEVNNLMSQFRGQIPEDQLERIRASVANQAVANLVNQKLLLNEARNRDITIDAEEIEARFSEIANHFPSKEAFVERLEMLGITVDQLRKEIAQKYLIEKLLETPKATITEPTEEAVKKFYDENQQSFAQPEQLRASHILLKVDPEAGPAERNEKKAKLEDLRAQVLDGGDFAALAGQFSDCPSKARGGDLDWFERGRMVEPFENAAFSLEIGAVSDVVETTFGYHIIKVTDRKAGGMQSLDEARPSIVEYLKQQDGEKVITDFIDGLRAKTDITYGEGYAPAVE